jgi:DNA adenine methylase
MIKSPLRYPGGKSKALKFLIPLIPQGSEFREPFVGGGSIWISLTQTNSFKSYWINDLNYSLMCFWDSALFDNDDLISFVSKYKTNQNKQLYIDMIKLKTTKVIEEGARFFILNRITFSGVTESGGYSEQAHKKRFTDSSIERLKSLKCLKKFDVKTSCEDFERVILAPGNDVVIFLDPPYFKAEKSKLYGKNGDLHTNFDHSRLKKILSLTKHKWLMTYDNSSFIKLLYKEFFIYEWSLQYGMTNKKSDINNELVISNFEITF